MKKFLPLAIVAVAFSGCASVAVTGDAIEQRTAFALGLDAGTFAITDRKDDGLRTEYKVVANNGQKYNCYVTGTISILGRVVSDAICNKPGEQAKNPLLGR